MQEMEVGRPSPDEIHASPAPGPRPRAYASLGRPIYGALDLGTNNCRLLIARRAHNNPCPSDFQVVDAFSRIVRLGEGMVQTGRLSDDSMNRTIDALQACAEKLARRGVTQVRSVATEACRIATNGAEFIRRVYAETGLALDVITPAEEARLAVLGCQTLIDRKSRRTLVFDIGGGSTELVIINRMGNSRQPNGQAGEFLRPAHMMRSWLSIPWGVVSLTETESHDPGTPQERLDAYARMKARVCQHLRPLRRHMSPDVQLLGASGTVTTLASLNLGLIHYDRRRIDGILTPTADLIAIARDLAAKSPAERAAIPGVGTDRADLVVAGCAILEALLGISGASHLRVADRGIREGILRSMIERDAAA